MQWTGKERHGGDRGCGEGCSGRGKERHVGERLWRRMQ